ncbi:MAG TPA: hypothetical protein VG795_14600 [Acidimicrobiia bacterium]|nr:hypothetical protein [Acidimicrobiia bacterium]
MSAGVLAMALVVAGCGDDDGGSSSENLSQDSVTTSSAAGGAATTAAGGAAGECKTEGTASAAASDEVVLTLNEFTIKASKQPKAGNISLKGENAGKENHEVVIVKGESADALPKDADGGLDEDKLPEGALIGEIEPFASGQVCSGVFNLPAGKYVLLCNITETEPDGTKENHVKEGMHTPFTVT